MILEDTIEQELVDASRLMVHANNAQTRAKTVYYKAIYNGLASVIEAILYMIIEKACTQDPTILEHPSKRVDRRIHDLNSSPLGSTKTLFISERTEEPFTFADVSKQFMDMIKFCRQHDITSKRLYKRIDTIRIKRNHVHLQIRTSTSRSYTRAHINSASDTIVELYGIFSSL